MKGEEEGMGFWMISLTLVLKANLCVSLERETELDRSMEAQAAACLRLAATHESGIQAAGAD